MTAAAFTAYLHKEWRSQRALLLAFAALAFASLALGFLFVPAGWLDGHNRRAGLVAAFVMAGLAGGVLFVAPQAVRGEFGPKDDQFLRRLPGALLPAFLAKTVFLLLAAAALPLCGTLAGELWLWAKGQPMAPLDEVFAFDTGLLLLLPGYAVAVPLVFAGAFWLPAARMAVGIAALLALAVGAGVVGIVGLHPGLERGIATWGHVPVFALAALATAFVSCVLGRRGGDHRRSAQLGGAALIVALLPQTLWFGREVAHYRHPDPAAWTKVETFGVAPDGRTAVVAASEHEAFYGALFTVDLGTGAARQWLPPASTANATDLLQPVQWTGAAQRRFWLLAHHGGGRELLDLATGSSASLVPDAQHALPVPPSLRPALTEERRLRTELRQPGGLPVWIADGCVHFAEPDGSVTTLPWTGPNESHRAVGHGIAVLGHHERAYFFDLVHRRFVVVPNQDFVGTLAIAGTWFGHRGTTDTWIAVDGADDTMRAEPRLTAQDQLLSLLDDRTALLLSKNEPSRLRAFRPQGEGVLDITVAEPLPAACEVRDPRQFPQAVLDAVGRRWLQVQDRSSMRVPVPARALLVVVDPASLTARVVLRSQEERLFVVGFDAEGRALVDEGHRRLLRVDATTGRSDVLLPHPAVR